MKKSENGAQVAQQEPLTTGVAEQVAENTNEKVVAEKATTENKTVALNVTAENVTGVVYAGIEFLISFFGFIGIVTNHQFSTLAAFIYIASFFVATSKEVVKFKLDGLFKINLGMLAIAFVQAMLLALLVNGNLNQDLAPIVTNILRFVLAFVPMRFAAYGAYYASSIFK